MTVTLWAVWYNRNKNYHEGKKERVQEVVDFIKAYVLEVDQLKSITESNIKSKEDCWRPLRNHEGLVMGYCAYPLGSTRDLTTAEAKACLQAIIFREEMSFRDLVVEGDALTVIKKLRLDSKDRSVIGNIIDEIKGKRTSFDHLSFEYTLRKRGEVSYYHAESGDGFFDKMACFSDELRFLGRTSMDFYGKCSDEEDQTVLGMFSGAKKRNCWVRK
ncbi:hypothetical protein Goari_019706 [Gossypium aridum]|uniref:RNase H type-1 domain-containing protein n=1 Tax=Gossypium aridum TaxID=34290 RepID=A0A7J8WTS7_GOSAI|nr:hypothetical protein [Gossypium aridum]